MKASSPENLGTVLIDLPDRCEIQLALSEVFSPESSGGKIEIVGPLYMSSEPEQNRLHLGLATAPSQISDASETMLTSFYLPNDPDFMAQYRWFAEVSGNGSEAIFMSSDPVCPVRLGPGLYKLVCEKWQGKSLKEKAELEIVVPVSASHARSGGFLPVKSDWSISDVLSFVEPEMAEQCLGRMGGHLRLWPVSGGFREPPRLRFIGGVWGRRNEQTAEETFYLPAGAPPNTILGHPLVLPLKEDPRNLTLERVVVQYEPVVGSDGIISSYDRRIGMLRFGGP